MPTTRSRITRTTPSSSAKLTTINTYHTALFAEFLEKLRATPDGDGTLLDHLMIIYGLGMSNGNGHDPRNLPVLLAGGGAGRLKSRPEHPVCHGYAAVKSAPDRARPVRRPVEKMYDSTGTLGAIG